MTTIAYKDGVMAADTRWSDDGVVTVHQSKLLKFDTGALLGGAGDCDDREIVNMFSKVRLISQLPSRSELGGIQLCYDGIFVLPFGRVFRVYTSGVAPGNRNCHLYDQFGLYEIHTRGPLAVGSGGVIARVAMECGKSAVEAVEVACRFDTSSGLPVTSVSLNP